MHIPLGTPFAHVESSQHENRKKFSLANMLSSDLPHGVPYLPKKGRYLDSCCPVLKVGPTSESSYLPLSKSTQCSSFLPRKRPMPRQLLSCFGGRSEKDKPSASTCDGLPS